MKKLLAAIILLASLALCAASCSGMHELVDGTDAGSSPTETASTASGETSQLTADDAQRIAEEIFTQSSDDAFILDDGVAYTGFGVGAASDFILVNIRKNGASYKAIKYIGTDDEPELICSVDGCTHSDIRCTAYVTNAVLLVSPAGNEDDVIYYTIDKTKIKTVAGHDVTLPKSGDGGNGALLEYNIKTGVRRCVTPSFPLTLEPPVMYCDGMLYFDEPYCVDVKTGDCMTGNIGGDVKTAGIYDGRVYMTVGNTLFCADRDLSNVKEVAVLQGCDMITAATVYGGVLYFFTNCARDTDENGYAVGGLRYDLAAYATDGTDSEVQIIAENVVTTHIGFYDGGLYFAEYDYHDYGYYGADKVTADTGGTLYRYDTVTKQTASVFGDCGADIEDIIYVDGETIIFGGTYYAGINEGYAYSKAPDEMKFFRYDIPSGELTIEYTVVI